MNIQSNGTGPRRIAIIGGGVSGLSAAYFLDDAADKEVTLYERSARLGGNALTVQAEMPDGKPYAVDPVAYLFLRPRYPFFTVWLKQLGIKTRSFTFENYLWDAHRSRGTLLSSNLRKVFTNPGKSITYFRDLYAFKQVIKTANKLEKAGKLHDDMPMKEFMAQVPGVRAGFLREVFYPLMSFAFHCELNSMPDQPCGTTMRSYANVASDPKAAYCIEGGVGTYIDAVHGLLKRTRVVLNSTVTAVRKVGAKVPLWQITTADGSMQEYDEVLLAIWPNQAAQILETGIQPGKEDPELQEMAGILSKVELAFCRATVHNDVTVMPTDKRHWTTYCYKFLPSTKHVMAAIWSGQAENASVFTTYDWNDTEAGIADPLNCTMVAGPVHAVNFHIRTPPRQALFEAQNHIHVNQGRAGLWFTGSYLRGTGFHEDGLVSTLETVKKLVPDHGSLARMRNLLEEV